MATLRPYNPSQPASDSASWQGISTHPDQTVTIGSAIAQHCQPGDLITLIGELGAGKTQLVRGLAQGLGIDPASVSSPTFVLIQEYQAAPDRPLLIHIDAYRLTTLADLESIGWADSRLAHRLADPLDGLAHPTAPLADPLFDGGIVVVEWADRLADQLSHDRLQIEIRHANDQHRLLTVTAHGAWTRRLPQLQPALGCALAAPR